MTRSSLITRRRVHDAWTMILIVSALAFAGVIVGFIIGVSVPRDYKCPTVPGAKVITTMDSKTGQYCVYAKDDYGKAKVRVKL